MRAPVHPQQAELFNEIAVSRADIAAWLDALPQLSSAPWRRAAYAQAYNVADKIRAAKAAGTWPIAD